MGILAWILAILGTLGAIMGVVTAVGVVPSLGVALTGMFWLALSAVLFLACIAPAISSSACEYPGR